jgi:hypothetical protein
VYLSSVKISSHFCIISLLSQLNVELHIVIFLITTPCSQVDGLQRFEGTNCLNLQDVNNMLLRNVGTYLRDYIISEPGCHDMNVTAVKKSNLIGQFLVRDFSFALSRKLRCKYRRSV